ncbi:GEVED domain-containing protein, partial [Photobacterium aquimaris]|uniref:GEVED domain-containing protein n=1 Tax=Photobacterium aquimaris TaxID=512643 RepID=UPI001F1EE0C7
AANVGVDNYRTTLSDDGARHIISTDLYLGTNATDGEIDAASPNTFALGDDNNTGTDDEDGVVYGVLSTTQSDYSATATITNNSTEPAYLYAWIDFDRNGRFDRDEFINSGVITVPAASGVTTETLSWSSMSGRTNDTNIYLRMRLTHELFDDAVTGATEDPRSYGATSSGEVEDHFLEVNDSVDKGDLDDSYVTKMTTGGPWHVIDGNNHIGAQVPDADGTDHMNGAATADDLAGNDDEDANIDDGTEGDTSYSTTISVTNGEGADIYLNAWVDWDRNGSFEPSEHVGATVATTDTNKTLSWTGLTPLDAGYYPIRIRLGNIALTSSDVGGDGGNGEVEDHLITVNSAGTVTIVDHVCLTNVFENSTTEYMHWTGSNGSYAEQFTSTEWSANLIKKTGQNVGRLQATHNDSIDQVDSGFVGLYGHRTDSLTVREVAQYRTQILSVTSGQVEITYEYLPAAGYENTTISVELNNFWNTSYYTDDMTFRVTGNHGQGRTYLRPPTGGLGNHVTTDYDPDGVEIVPGTTYTVFDLRQEHHAGTGGSGGYAYPVFTLAAGQSITFTIGNIPSSISTDWQFDTGHYAVNNCTSLYADDYGDAPASYGTYSADNGAQHTATSTLYIGTTQADTESNGQPSANADADDLTGTDDEDNLTIPVLSPSMTTWSLDVPVTNTTGNPATLYAWVDHDLDGQFQADELTSVAVPDGTNNANVTLDWSNLSGGDGGKVGDSVIRLRLTTDDLDTTQSDNIGTADVDERALGAANDGEVEDHHHKVTFHWL